ncbi:tRNA lysidine(34) synthetase TilS [soil metagenome]
MRDEAIAELAAAARESGLIERSTSGVVLISGGPDSACTAAAVAAVAGVASVPALHINYGLRDSADRDERRCRDLCALLRIDLHIERAKPGDLQGHLQSAARDVRYRAAERLMVRTGSDWIATGHTRTDQLETTLYRLASSPGSRALLGLSERSGRVIRPLISLTRDETRALATAANLPFADDETNEDPRFARNRIRADVVPALEEVNPSAQRNAAETRAEMAEEAVLLERVVLDSLEAAGSPAGAVSVDARSLGEFSPALRRLALRALAERAAGHKVSLGRARAKAIAEIARQPEGGMIELSGGVRAICEAGTVRFEVATSIDAAPVPQAVSRTVPGRCRIGEWEIRAELHPSPVDPAGPGLATLDASTLGSRLEVRTWREGDRIRPLGMEGTKTLQDLFTDAGVPRSDRSKLPVITAGERVAWVAGVAVSTDFRLGSKTETVAVLSLRRAS